MPRTSIEKMGVATVKMPRIMMYALHYVAKKLGIHSLAELVRISIIDFMRAVRRGEDVSVDYHEFLDSVARYLNIGDDMLSELMHLAVFSFKMTPSFRERVERFREEYLYPSLSEVVRHALMWKISKVLFEEDEEDG